MRGDVHSLFSLRCGGKRSRVETDRALILVKGDLLTTGIRTGRKEADWGYVDHHTREYQDNGGKGLRGRFLADQGR